MTVHQFIGKKALILISLLFATFTDATPLFYGQAGTMSSSSSITSSGNWTVANTNQTLTAPGGTGTVKFTSVIPDTNAQYSKNNAAYVIFVENDTLAVATGDTLKFKDSGGGGLSCTVVDNATSVTVGTVGF